MLPCVHSSQEHFSAVDFLIFTLTSQLVGKRCNIGIRCDYNLQTGPI